MSSFWSIPGQWAAMIWYGFLRRVLRTSYALLYLLYALLYLLYAIYGDSYSHGAHHEIESICKDPRPSQGFRGGLMSDDHWLPRRDGMVATRQTDRHGPKLFRSVLVLDEAYASTIFGLQLLTTWNNRQCKLNLMNGLYSLENTRKAHYGEIVANCRIRGRNKHECKKGLSGCVKLRSYFPPFGRRIQSLPII